MRAFIAVELPQEIKDSLSRLQGQLKKSGADVKWIEPNNIHLTLKFLGEIDEKQLEKIIRIIEDTVKDKNAFHARISSIGAFPKINYPRVIWVAIDKGDNEAKQTAKELEEKIAKIGIPRENKAFSSHITIGRTRSTINRERLVKDLSALENNLANTDLEFIVAKITLFKSALTPNGPIYESLKEASLKTT
jgi:RNA 2',3'-cyclic 3'-phosphodiesterase